MSVQHILHVSLRLITMVLTSVLCLPLYCIYLLCGHDDFRSLDAYNRDCHRYFLLRLILVAAVRLYLTGTTDHHKENLLSK